MQNTQFSCPKCNARADLLSAIRVNEDDDIFEIPYKQKYTISCTACGWNTAISQAMLLDYLFKYPGFDENSVAITQDSLEDIKGFSEYVDIVIDEIERLPLHYSNYAENKLEFLDDFRGNITRAKRITEKQWRALIRIHIEVRKKLDR